MGVWLLIVLFVPGLLCSLCPCSLSGITGRSASAPAPAALTPAGGSVAAPALPTGAPALPGRGTATPAPALACTPTPAGSGTVAPAAPAGTVTPTSRPPPAGR